ncbi:MAG: CoA-binding protein [Firmicutes bacterium]|nr:CoA-binding protein [Bacillota bacterium]
MHILLPDDKMIIKLFEQARSIAVVGLSNKPERDSFRVSQYMQKKGYRIIPVNPRVNKVLGEQSYSDLLSVPDTIDIVNIFRRSEHVPSIVAEAIKINPMAIWLQLGIINEEAAKTAELNGITVVMDKCIMVEHRRLKG